MQYIKFTYVDAVTGVSVAKAPAKNGPVFPTIAGLQFIRARESQYPTNVPQFYGTCDDEADTSVEGVLSVMTPEAWLSEVLEELKVQVTANRWRVMTGGIEISGVQVGTTIDDQNRITSVLGNYEHAGLSDESIISFKAASGFVKITIAQLKEIAGAIGQHVQVCYDAEEMHFNAIEALTTREQIRDYDIDVGWPDPVIETEPT